MKPDRSDYEIWLIDWLDGKLDQAGIDQLMQFLNENPDLKEEAEALSQTSLNVVTPVYSRKKSLKKNAAQLPESQVEYLSVAFLENDITPEQKEDLEAYLKANPGNRIIFDSILKTRLHQDHNIKFKDRKNLLKGQSRVRILAIPSVWMSVAAGIALLIAGTFLLNQKQVQNDVQIVSSLVQDPVQNIPSSTAIIASSETQTNTGNDKETSEPSPEIKMPENITEALVAQVNTDDIFQPGESPRMLEEGPTQVRVTSPSITTNLQMNHLILAQAIPPKQEQMDDGRSKFEKFIARNFREVLLKEEVPVDSKLKSYELAEAGIEGLNKLLGWEMTLVKNNDEEGDVQSVSFNSRLLKFNTTVKNEESVVTF